MSRLENRVAIDQVTAESGVFAFVFTRFFTVSVWAV